MRAQRPLSILACILARLLDGSCQKLMVRRYIVTPRECSTPAIAAVYKNFQRCLLDVAGVYRVSITSDTSCEVQVLVTASAFEFQNVHDHCSHSYFDFIEDNLSEQVLNEPSKTDPSKVRPPSSPNKRGNEEKKIRYVSFYSL